MPLWGNKGGCCGNSRPRHIVWHGSGNRRKRPSAKSISPMVAPTEPVRQWGAGTGKNKWRRTIRRRQSRPRYVRLAFSAPSCEPVARRRSRTSWPISEETCRWGSCIGRPTRRSNRPMLRWRWRAAWRRWDGYVVSWTAKPKDNPECAWRKVRTSLPCLLISACLVHVLSVWMMSYFVSLLKFWFSLSF